MLRSGLVKVYVDVLIIFILVITLTVLVFVLNTTQIKIKSIMRTRGKDNKRNKILLYAGKLQLAETP
jgi:hypothetical protein